MGPESGRGRAHRTGWTDPDRLYRDGGGQGGDRDLGPPAPGRWGRVGDPGLPAQGTVGDGVQTGTLDHLHWGRWGTVFDLVEAGTPDHLNRDRGGWGGGRDPGPPGPPTLGTCWTGWRQGSRTPAPGHWGPKGLPRVLCCEWGAGSIPAGSDESGPGGRDIFPQWVAGQGVRGLWGETQQGGCVNWDVKL